MGLLLANFGFHYEINFVKEDNDWIGLGSDEASGLGFRVIPCLQPRGRFVGSFHKQNVRRLQHWLIPYVQIQ
jgi:hypothetical protein